MKKAASPLMAVLWVYVGAIQMLTAFGSGVHTLQLLGMDVPISPVQLRLRPQGFDLFAMALGLLLTAFGVLLLVRAWRTRRAGS